MKRKIFISNEVNHSAETKKAGKFTIASLYTIVETKQREIAEAITYIEELERELDEVKSSYSEMSEKLERGENVLLTDDGIIKKVLELRAKNYAPSLISEKLSYLGVEVSTNRVKDIVNSELSAEHELYLSQCKKAYEEAIKINSSVLKQTSIEEIQRLIDSCYEDLERLETDDIKLRSSLRIEVKGLINERNNLIKNIDSFIETQEDVEISDMLEEFEQESNNIINFKTTEGVKIRKVGGG